MKKVAVMQPYIFPYMGYFQLVSAVDTFIFYDDVNFIKQGWINRNNILVNEKKQVITFPCIGISSFKKINEVEINLKDKKNRKILKTIEQSYAKAPYFSDVFELILKIFAGEHHNIASLAADSVIKTCSYLGIKKEFQFSSKKHSESLNMDRADRLVNICTKEQSTHYINPIGGQELYNKTYFKERGIQLDFLEPAMTEYKQFENEFVPYLSIIDVLMFNSKEETLKRLNKYNLI
jgi:hypothetical protein